MRATVSLRALRAALDRVAPICGNWWEPPILQTVRVQAVVDAVELTATNLDIEITTSVAASGVEPGAVCLPNLIHRVVRSLPRWDLITLRRVDDVRAALEFPDGRAALASLDADDFPTMNPESAETRCFDLAAADFKAILTNLFACISTEETRYYLNGVFMHVAEDRLHFVATNGHVLARISRPTPRSDIPAVIVPKDAVASLIRLIGRPSPEATIGVTCFVNKAAECRWITFTDTAAGWVLTTKLIDGTYPDYNRVIPKNGRPVLTVHRSDWLTKLARIRAYQPRSGPLIGSVLSISQTSTAISASSPDVGEIVLALKTSLVEPDLDKRTFGLNPRYIADVLRAHVGADPVLRIEDEPRAPVVLESAEVLTVIMPRTIDKKEEIALPEGAVA